MYVFVLDGTSVLAKEISVAKLTKILEGLINLPTLSVYHIFDSRYCTRSYLTRMAGVGVALKLLKKKIIKKHEKENTNDGSRVSLHVRAFSQRTYHL